MSWYCTLNGVISRRVHVIRLMDAFAARVSDAQTVIPSEYATGKRKAGAGIGRSSMDDHKTALGVQWQSGVAGVSLIERLIGTPIEMDACP